MYVALEGIDTAGKSTQIALLKEYFKDAIFTFEPGATTLGKEIREILLHSTESLSKKAEMLLFLADRAEHYAKVLEPNASKLIISDRSLISGMAYAKDLDFKILEIFNTFALNGFLPKKVVFLKLQKEELQNRLSQKGADKIEKRGIAYLLELQVRLEEVIAYLNIESLMLDASLKKEEIFKNIVEFIQS